MNILKNRSLACNLTALLFAYIGYAVLMKGIITGRDQQNFLTWILWIALDAIALVATIRKRGNWLILAGYVVGGSMIFLTLCFNRSGSWSYAETLTSVLVVVCLIVWRMSGDKGAIIASTLSVIVAGLPGLVDAWKTPETFPTAVYIIYVAANAMATAAGKDWSVPERFYAAGCTALCVIYVAVVMLRS